MQDGSGEDQTHSRVGRKGSEDVFMGSLMDDQLQDGESSSAEMAVDVEDKLSGGREVETSTQLSASFPGLNTSTSMSRTASTETSCSYSADEVSKQIEADACG